MGGKDYEYTTEASPPILGGERHPPSPWLIAVVIPLAWTLITGVLVGLTALFVLWLGGLPAWPAGLLVAAAVLLMWFSKLGKVITWLETYFQVDINGDGIAGPVPEARVTLEITRDHGRRMTFLQTGMSDKTLRQFARAALQGNTSVAAMDRYGIKRAGLEELRQRLFEHDLAEWKHGEVNQGWMLTADGRAAMEKYLQRGELPPALS